jgi:hypothetical protein
MIFSNVAKSFLFTCAALLMALPVVQSRAAPAPRISGACNPTKVKFALSGRGTTTTSTTLTNLPETAIPFTQARTGCVILDFTASIGLSDPPPGGVNIRAALAHSDGTAVSGRPFSVRLNFPDGNFDTRTIQFVFPNVTPGSYIIRMQTDSSNGGGIHVSSPNTVLHYN